MLNFTYYAFEQCTKKSPYYAPTTTANMPQFVFNDFIANITACYALYFYVLQCSYVWPVMLNIIFIYEYIWT